MTISRTDARAKGLMFYFTGIPCVHGHIDARYVSKGGCRTCERERAKKLYDEKYKTEFSRARPRIGEERPQSANAKIQAEYRKKHANDPVYLEKRRQYARDWRAKNLERSKEIARGTAERRREREKK